MLSVGRGGATRAAGVDAAAARAAAREGLLYAKAAPLFAPWSAARRMLLAVSGGPDSIALMLLAAAWARGRGGSPAIDVATVDHGLRPNSAAEAAAVGAAAARLGLPHAVLTWRGGKPNTRVQERARKARYALLCDHALDIAADVLATGHHADDQAETILFRLVRGSGPAGLAGMAASIARGGVEHARPLLGCGKAELIALCEAEDHSFVIDPSNSDPAFARTRMRALALALADAGLDRDALLRLGRRAARAEQALAARAAAVAESLAATRATGFYRAAAARLADEPEEIALRVLAGEIRLIVDAARPLRLERLETVAGAMRCALRAGAPFAATLGGAALRLDRARTLTIQREPGRRRGVAAHHRPAGESATCAPGRASSVPLALGAATPTLMPG